MGWMLGCSLVLPVSPGWAQTAETIPFRKTDERRYDFDIKAQSLTSALGIFGRQTGLQVSFDAELALGLRAPALKGRMTESQALQQLLQETGLEWTLTPERTLLLHRPQSSNETMNLTTVNVLAEGHQESAYGPVQGYRATRTSTGTKTDTALRDVPQSIQVVSRQVLEDQQITSLGDALTNVSSIQRANSHGGSSESFVIRGFNAVTYAIDGMLISPLVERPEAITDMASVERIEVLKGPASVLYGRGNPGGLINLVTRRPTFAPEASLKAQTGTYGFHRLEGSFSGPLSDTFAGRLSMAWQTKEGFRDTFRDNRHTYFAPTFRWQPSADTLLDAGLEYIDQSSQFDRGLIPTNGKIHLRGDRFLHEPWSRDKADKVSAWYRIEHQLNDWLTLRQMTRWDDSNKDRFVVDLRDLASDGRTLRRRTTHGDEEVRTLDMQFEAIAKFATGSIQHTALVGYEYIDGHRWLKNRRGSLASIDIHNPVYGARPGPLSFNGKYELDLQSYSAYFQDQIDLNEQWKLLVGARWDKTEQYNTSLDSDNNRTATDIDPTEVSPRVGLVYQPTDWLALYASYSSSFSPQGDIDRNHKALDPETGDQYEIGAKLDLIPDRLSLTLAAFEIIRENVSAPDPTADEYSIQTGEQRSRGIELDISGQPLDGWNLIGNISVINAKVTKDSVIKENNKRPGVPTFSGSLWSTYQVQTGKLKGLGLGGGMIFASEREGDIENTYNVGGYTRFDATLFYDLGQRFRVSLNGRNITNRKYIETVAGTDGNYAGEPASVIATLSAKF